MVLCGESCAGKSTFIEQGMNELAEVKFYLPKDVDVFARDFYGATEDIARFSLQRNTRIGPVDAWIDSDGLHFARAFLYQKSEDNDQSLQRIFKKVNAMIVVISAQRLLDLNRRSADDATRKNAALIYDQYRNGLDDFKPSWYKWVSRFGFKIHFVVTQSGDVIDSPRAWKDLKKSISTFSKRTNIGRYCDKAVLCDSVPEPLRSAGFPVASADWGEGRGRKLELLDAESPICSAGVVMANILGKLEFRDHPFLHDIS